MKDKNSQFSYLFLFGVSCYLEKNPMSLITWLVNSLMSLNSTIFCQYVKVWFFLYINAPSKNHVGRLTLLDGSHTNWTLSIWSCWGIYDALQAFLNAILRRFTLSPICTKFSSSLFDLQTQTQINNIQLMSRECKKCILLSSCLYVLDEFAIFATNVSSRLMYLDMPSLINLDHCTKHDNIIKYISIQCNLILLLQYSTI